MENAIPLNMGMILYPHDYAPLNKILHFSVLNKLCKSVFQIENKYYPQFQLLGECQYECEDYFL